MVAVGGKSAPKAAEPDIEVASASLVTVTYNALHHRVETVIVEPETLSP
jgi:hypothetical protein